MTGKWWRKKWYWIFCILFTFFGVLALDALLFPEQPLGRPLFCAAALSVGVLLAYFAYMGKPTFKIPPKTLRRIIFMAFGAFTVGSLSWAFVVLPLASYFDIPGPIVILLLFVLMVACALIVDTIMKRRDYRPFMEGGGKI